MFLSFDKSELFKSILQLVFFCVVSVQEFAFLLLKEEVLLVVFFSFADVTFFVLEENWWN